MDDNLNNKNDDEKEVVIKLEKWQVERLLGAARMGILVEDWNSALSYAETGWTDTHAGKWILNVGRVIELIKEQTGVENEYRGCYGDSERLDGIVCNKCEEWHKERYLYEKETHEEWLRTDEGKKWMEKEKNGITRKFFSTKITHRIKRAAQNFTDNVGAEIKIK